MLLLDEPTRGVDVGARAEIYAVVRALADSGVAVVVVSSEVEEVLGLADRVLVVREGRVVHEGPADRDRRVASPRPRHGRKRRMSEHRTTPGTDQGPDLTAVENTVAPTSDTVRVEHAAAESESARRAAPA